MERVFMTMGNLCIMFEDFVVELMLIINVNNIEYLKREEGVGC